MATQEKLKKSVQPYTWGVKRHLVSKDKNQDIWVIKSFVNIHNHVMASPKSMSYLRCHKMMNVAAKKILLKSLVKKVYLLGEGCFNV